LTVLLSQASRQGLSQLTLALPLLLPRELWEVWELEGLPLQELAVALDTVSWGGQSTAGQGTSKHCTMFFVQPALAASPDWQQCKLSAHSTAAANMLVCTLTVSEQNPSVAH
jgi:hypothetical protein